ncbi:MAG TPA: sigma-54-dependent Fis family transcriptional regulator [Bryobacteraceae bacterium]|nr:sigma-54-dependent Fis family transcriptional regulator [Bryobacteraceae bacterium]
MSTTEGQSLATQKLRAFIDSVLAIAWSALPDGSLDFINQQFRDYTGLSLDQLIGWEWKSVVHPDDIHKLAAWWQDVRQSQQAGTTEKRLRRFDGAYRWFRIAAAPVHDEQANLVRWCGINTDIDDLKCSEQKYRQEAEDLRTITDAIRQSIAVLAGDGTILYVNQVFQETTGLTMREVNDKTLHKRVFHPDDLDRVLAERREGLSRGTPFEYEARLLMKDGQYRWWLIQYNPLKDEHGHIIRWYGAGTYIDDRKRAEQELKRSEADLRTLIDAVRQYVTVLAPDGKVLYTNRVALDLTGLTVGEVSDGGFFPRAFHPDDVDRVRAERQENLLRGTPFDLQMRLRFRNGQYRWHLFQYNPLVDESGQIIRWYCTATDIDDQKKTEERLRNENLVLREEIDRFSMFEEIVGSSKPMRQVLEQVEKVAPSDSTVLILGETGTGKELIARALHRRSKRATRAFIRVNCGAIPQSLIASELFGHEKGAFTGALQRRVGRFEAADGGTLFLDEIGELPMETQIALLRVLQEREFERVGSNHPVKVDVRLITATNRDLQSAVAAGTFRQDLFYRLNVFPIAVPPLRERAEDIPLLVEYFIGRYCNTAGKNIRNIRKDTLEALRAYPWPGNIRELQNVVERAVILSETDTFSVDESWLMREPTDSPRSHEALAGLADRELETIEAALAESHGRIGGPSGAAARLGIPRQTLESKIQRLGIDKYRHKSAKSK